MLKGKPMNIYETHKDNLIVRCNQRGYSLEEVMPCVIEQKDGDVWMIDVDHPAYPSRSKENFEHPSYKIMKDIKEGKIKNDIYIGEGVGTEIKKLLAWMNIRPTANCSCNKRAKLLNEKGILWCKENQEAICVWLKEEAINRKLPFFKYGAMKIIKMAISRAERKHK